MAGIKPEKDPSGRQGVKTGIDFHGLRDDFAGLPGELGVPLHVARSMIGHSEDAMTLYYQPPAKRLSAKRRASSTPGSGPRPQSRPIHRPARNDRLGMRPGRSNQSESDEEVAALERETGLPTMSRGPSVSGEGVHAGSTVLSSRREVRALMCAETRSRGWRNA